MKSLNPYLTFDGNCEEAFNFYKSVFEIEFEFFGRFSEMPPQEGVTLSEEEMNRVMHVAIKVGENTLMGSDSGGGWAPEMAVGNNFSLSIATESKEEADHLFGKLSEGGKITMPMDQTFWGDYFGMCTDKFDINWMISYNENQQ